MHEWLLKPIRFLKGVGPSKAVKLSKINIFTCLDLLEHYPRRYEDRSNVLSIAELTCGNMHSFWGIVNNTESHSTRGPIITKVWVRDNTATAELVWFGQPGRKKLYKNGMKIFIYGKVERYFSKIQVKNPDVEICEEETIDLHCRILPVYPAGDNINQNMLRSLVKQILDNCSEFPNLLPAEVVHEFKLLNRYEAIRTLHFPDNSEALSKARRTMVFEELFLLQCGLAIYKKQTKQNYRGIKHRADGDLIKQAEQGLSFKLTNEQLSVLYEIKTDMEDTTAMQRLVQGDVGSGKTILAALALVKTVENGYQGAMMAPTEILAEQHYHTLTKILSPLGIKLSILTGKLSKVQREEILSLLKQGLIDVVVGTHALIQEDVEFARLALAITDEQHRFGVNQRAKLQDKGQLPDVLVMTATPIPRTLALTVYGDLDVSTIRELPPGRKAIRTYARGADRRELIYKFIIGEIKKGRQAYIVCPLVEESEKIDAQSAVSLFERLSGSFFKDIACGLVHGRMKPAEKESIMETFYNGEIKILVATTVIEVGVNVPNATIIVIECADRFGLAQLHQLRGRVGRGHYQSYCILLHEGSSSQIPERLKIMTEVSDGFEIAEKDIVLRGPGQFFGIRQHGIPDLKIADILTDRDILLEARKAAQSIIDNQKLVNTIIPVLHDRFRGHLGNIICG